MGLTTHLHLVPTLLSSGAIFHSPYMSHDLYCDNFTFTLACIYMPTCVHTHKPYTSMYNSKYICTYTLIQTCLHVLRHTPPHTHTHTSTHTCLHMHTYALKHTYMYLCTCAYTASYTLPIIRLHKNGNCQVRCFCPTFCHSTKLLNHV